MELVWRYSALTMRQFSPQHAATRMPFANGWILSADRGSVMTPLNLNCRYALIENVLLIWTFPLKT